jgi:hypothetical protein
LLGGGTGGSRQTCGGGSGSAEIGGRICALGLLRQPILRACLGDRQRCSPEISDAAGLEAGDAAAVWRSGGCCRPGGPAICGSEGPAVLQVWRSGDLRPGFGDAAVLRVWASAVQRLANGSGGLVMKAAPAVTVGLITGVSDSGA